MNLLTELQDQKLGCQDREYLLLPHPITHCLHRPDSSWPQRRELNTCPRSSRSSVTGQVSDSRLCMWDRQPYLVTTNVPAVREALNAILYPDGQCVIRYEDRCSILTKWQSGHLSHWLLPVLRAL
jgi:hypothetical protein